MTWSIARRCVLAVAVLIAVQPVFAEDDFEAIRAAGDPVQQRRHVWAVADRLMGGQEPAFESWHGERDSLFDNPVEGPAGIRGFARAASSNSDVATSAARGAPLVAYSLFNDAARDHIRNLRLFSRFELEHLRKAGAEDETIPGTRKIPDFPADAIIIKTSWWPVASAGMTPLPVWDPETNPPNPSGNSYLGWRRIVAIDPALKEGTSTASAADFAGRHFADAAIVGLLAFIHLRVDRDLADRLMRDGEAGAAILLALGRPLMSGDHLVLVAANIATREIRNWIWAALWWHDHADRGPFAADRPADQSAPLGHYLMQTAWDVEYPREADGSPHICFNPWLEGRFPNGGTSSNCLACHNRASDPAPKFLPPARGVPRLADDAAFAPGTLRTSLLWSIPLHAYWDNPE